MDNKNGRDIEIWIENGVFRIFLKIKILIMHDSHSWYTNYDAIHVAIGLFFYSVH